MSEPTIIVLDGNPDAMYELAIHLLNKSLKNPEQRELIDKVMADKRVGKREAFAIGFTYGVAATMNEVSHGNINKLGEG